MTTSSRLRCVFYAAVAVIALIATWSQNIAYMNAPGGFLLDFLTDLKANAAARSITVDIILLFLAAAVLMVIEARRHGVRYVWAYIAGGMLIAISVTFPLFLIAREMRLSDTTDVRMNKVDAVLMTVLTLGVLSGTGWILMR